MNNEQIKEKIAHLKQLSNNYFTVVVMITTGCLGLFFVNISIIKLTALLIIGIYFALLFFAKFIDSNNLIDKLIKDLK